MKLGSVFGLMALALSLATTGFAQSDKPLRDERTPGENGRMAVALQEAYSKETGLHDRYLAYAGKADEEGYGQVASMFRAIAKGEEIHASRLAALISRNAQVSKGTAAETVMPLSTKENLQTSLAEQLQERDDMYPRLLQQARERKDKQAVKTLQDNMAAEPTHLAWFRQALDDLEGYKGNNIDFYICSNCGNAVRALQGSKCDVCSASKDQFVRVQ